MTARVADGERLAAWCGVVLVGGGAALAGLLEVLLVPLYLGSVIFPLTVALAVLSNVGLPVLSRRLVPRGIAAALPFVVWLVVVIAFGLTARPEGDVILPGGPLQWVSYAVLLAGAAAGVITLVVVGSGPVTPGRRGSGSPGA